ncbi:hypothetical protein AX14_005365 [Amanita brunnescens Koide BX004]|nr:hypothetical protein AX14_005365 [Amanita brunnescens Koide BX004]
MTANDSPWEGVRWTKLRPPPKYSTIRRDGQAIEDVATLFDVMHSHFSTSPAENDISWEAINAIPEHEVRSFPPISQKEIWDALRPTSNSSAPGPDHVTWRHIKLALSFPDTDVALAALFNKVCFTGTWPSHFKESISVIIPKPNKPDYSIPKAYRPIALLNTLGKLLTKILANRLQHDAAQYGILHRDQFGEIQGHSTIDAGLVLTDFISEHRERGWHTSVCAVDVAQFFPSLSHAVMGAVLKRLGFSPVLVTLIESYFRDRVTTYKWDSATSKTYNFSLGTPQGDCLSPILSALYISVAIRRVFPETMPPSTTRCLFFVDDGVIITASPSLQTNIAILRLYLLLLLQALGDIGLQVEASKTELMHFYAFELTASRRLAIVQQPHLTFTWKQAPTLDFSYHVQFYTNKAFSTIRACSMLGNSVHGIGPRQRAHAYQACVLSVLTYGLALWYTTWGAGVIHLVKRMERVHSYALGWVIGAFRTSPVGSRELVAGIPPLKIILNMRLQGTTARILSLGENHSLYRAWTLRWLPTALSHVTPRHRARHLPTDNPLTRLSATAVREQFSPHHPVARPGERIADIYAHRLFFNLSAPKRSSKFFNGWVNSFKKKIEDLKTDGHTLVFTDGAYWAKSSRASYAFTVHDAHGWNDHYGWCPADLDSHSSQMASIQINMILKDHLATTNNIFSFAYCPSHVGIEGNECADELTKQGAAIGPATPLKILRSNFIGQFKRDMTTHWRALATSHSYKGRSWLPIKRRGRKFKPDIVNKSCKAFFMTLAGNDITTISRMARALTNHAPTGEYRRRFHPDEPTFCKTCGPETEHTRSHVLFACPQYDSLAASFTDWKNTRRNDKSWKIFFQANPSAFTFGDLPDDVH